MSIDFVSLHALDCFSRFSVQVLSLLERIENKKTHWVDRGQEGACIDRKSCFVLFCWTNFQFCSTVKQPYALCRKKEKRNTWNRSASPPPERATVKLNTDAEKWGYCMLWEVGHAGRGRFQFLLRAFKFIDANCLWIVFPRAWSRFDF